MPSDRRLVAAPTTNSERLITASGTHFRNRYARARGTVTTFLLMLGASVLGGLIVAFVIAGAFFVEWLRAAR